MSEENAIRAVGERVIETWNAHDMKAFARLFRKDADFVNVYGSWWTDRQEIEDQHAATHATVFRNSTLSAKEMRVKLLRRDVASLHILWDLVGLVAPDGTPMPPRKGVLLYVLVKESGGWQIAVGQNTDIVPPPGARS